MKQTAIQLLKESIDYEMKLGTKMVINWDMYLETQKKQMIEFAYGFYDNCFTKDGIIQKTAGEYYNETYK
jgi:hypothetical protein